MADIIVEKGKLNGGYKVVERIKPNFKGCMAAGYNAYNGFKIKPGEKKRLRIEGGRILKQLSCYWT